jgi:hypothetical protein
MEITTNNIPRDVVYGWELDDAQTEELRKEFSYIKWEDWHDAEFFQYKGEWYDLGEFMRTTGMESLRDWDGYHSDTYFSGIVVKYAEDNERIVVGRYCA